MDKQGQGDDQRGALRVVIDQRIEGPPVMIGRKAPGLWNIGGDVRSPWA